MTRSASSDVAVEKTMCLSEAEFHRSMGVLDQELRPAASQRIRCGEGSVTVSFEPLPDVTLGTLLALPRARVLLVFDSVVSPAHRREFLERFDIAFQRGGG